MDSKENFVFSWYQLMEQFFLPFKFFTRKLLNCFVILLPVIPRSLILSWYINQPSIRVILSEILLHWMLIFLSNLFRSKQGCQWKQEFWTSQTVSQLKMFFSS